MKIGWANKSIFKNLRGELQAMTDRAFERGALPYLRMVHPHLVNAPARRGFDAAGIDHLEPAEAGPFPVAVQCKGFEVRDLGPRQIRQAVASIRKFGGSGLKADTYLFVHNRLGKEEAFRKAVLRELGKLESEGAARTAELWDVDALAKNALTALYRRLATVARNGNLSVVKEYAESEPDLCEPLDEVPFRVDELVVDQYRLVAVTEGRERVADPAKSLADAEASFTLLVGYAGFGKTTTTLRLVRESGLNTLFVPAARLERLTTTNILEQCIDIETLIADFSEEDRPTVRRAARLVIDVFFARDNKTFLVIIDGLDECTAIARRGGLQDLFNALRRVRSRMILTVRKEFLDARSADFSSAAGIVSPDVHRRRNQPLKRVELLPWTDDRISVLVRRYAARVNGAGRDRLLALAAQVETGSYNDVYGDIPRRPLFLRFIMETVESSGVHAVSRTGLFEEWARLKIVRDSVRPARFGGGRLPIGSETSLDDVVETAFEAMSWAARCMTRVVDGLVELLPTCAAADVLGGPPLHGRANLESLLLNSLLVPAGARKTPEPLQIRFAHRAYHEYFLARFVGANAKTFAGAAIPADVLEWLGGFGSEGVRRLPTKPRHSDLAQNDGFDR